MQGESASEQTFGFIVSVLKRMLMRREPVGAMMISVTSGLTWLTEVKRSRHVSVPKGGGFTYLFPSTHLCIGFRV